jgi:hypothetical protein
MLSRPLRATPKGPFPPIYREPPGVAGAAAGLWCGVEPTTRRGLHRGTAARFIPHRGGFTVG